mmetsp:Transcript_36651/g.76299  ORF Transcript_36651/g.76299 Transcript_36651/m.76299 type:complete len:227 (-) Transcript_36651:796-1476(-)
MVWHLATLFGLFLIGALVTKSSSAHTLREQFAHTTGTNFRQTLVRIVNATHAEGTHTQVHHHTIEQNHGCHITAIVNSVLQVRHEQQITRINKAIVNGVMANLTNHGAGLGRVGTIFVHKGTQVGYGARVISIEIGIVHCGFAAIGSWMDLGIIQFRIGGNLVARHGASGMQHGHFTILLGKQGGLIDQGGNVIMTVVQVLNTQLGQGSGFVRHFLRFKVSLEACQ